MKISQADIDAILKWLNHNWQGQKLCPICQKNNWNISDTVYEIREFQGGGLVVGGPVYPTIGVICNVCGHTLFFNALKLGIIKGPPKKDGGDSD